MFDHRWCHRQEESEFGHSDSWALVEHVIKWELSLFPALLMEEAAAFATRLHLSLMFSMRPVKRQARLVKHHLEAKTCAMRASIQTSGILGSNHSLSLWLTHEVPGGIQILTRRQQQRVEGLFTHARHHVRPSISLLSFDYSAYACPLNSSTPAWCLIFFNVDKVAI